MQKAWDEIAKLVAANAVHRKGFTLGQVSDEFILAGAQSELDELKQTPNDPVELSDLLGVLFHYAIKKGWPLALLESCLLEKLAIRFKGPSHETASGNCAEYPDGEQNNSRSV